MMLYLIFYEKSNFHLKNHFFSIICYKQPGGILNVKTYRDTKCRYLDM